MGSFLSVVHLIRKSLWWFLQAIRVQLVMIMLSLPFLIAWGLPFSLLSPLGNLIFNPFLVVFLFLSSLVFFCELLSIPNTLLIMLLEWISSLWLNGISYVSDSMLVTCSSNAMFIVMPMSILVLLFNKKLKPGIYHMLVHLLVIFIMTISIAGALYMSRRLQKPCLLTIERGACPVTLISGNSRMLMVDPGSRSSKLSISSWVTYTLLPQLARCNGTQVLDYDLILSYSLGSLNCADYLCTHALVKTIILPAKPVRLSSKTAQAFKQLVQSALTHNVILIFIKQDPLTLDLDIPVTIAAQASGQGQSSPKNVLTATCVVAEKSIALSSRLR